MMESDPNGWAKEVDEIEKDRQQAHEEFDEEFPQLKPVKEFLDELTDEERRYLFTYYCHECGTKDVPCRCWDDT